MATPDWPSMISPLHNVSLISVAVVGSIVIIEQRRP
jgi:hypothetical protein